MDFSSIHPQRKPSALGKRERALLANALEQDAKERGTLVRHCRGRVLSDHEDFRKRNNSMPRAEPGHTCFKQCASKQLGLETLLGTAAVAAGQPIVEKPTGPLGNASKKTSYASRTASRILGKRRFPFGLKLPAPTDTTLR